MVKVILDLNFLLIPLQFRIDIFEELNGLLGRAEPVILSTTIEEIRRILKRSSGMRYLQFSTALRLAEKCEVINVERRRGESYDDVILRVAKDTGMPVATNDSELRKRLRKAGLTTIYLRQKSKLEIDGYV